MNYNINIPKHVKNILEHLNAGNYEAFVVGGCLRDIFMQKMPADWDVCTIATPDEVMQLFDNVTPVIPTGIKHGTVTILSDSVPVEVTTYRTDGTYADNRHPENVKFIKSLDEDLARRDFTINAMAYNPYVGLVDIFGGKNDIANKTIRTVGNPYDRFKEDALRILRALRFSAVCGFSIEGETSAAIHTLSNLLDTISAERSLAELKRILLADKPSKIIEEYIDVFKIIIPKLNHSDYFKMLDILPPNLTLRMTALLGDFSSTEITSTLNSLRSEKALKKGILSIIENSDTTPTNKAETKNFLHIHGVENAKNILTFGYYKGVALGNDSSSFKNALLMIEDILRNDECYSLDTLAVNGSDLIKIGISSGRQIGDILDTLLSFVINGKIQNNKEILISTATDLLNSI